MVITINKKSNQIEGSYLQNVLFLSYIQLYVYVNTSFINETALLFHYIICIAAFFLLLIENYDLQVNA